MNRYCFFGIVLADTYYILCFGTVSKQGLYKGKKENLEHLQWNFDQKFLEVAISFFWGKAFGPSFTGYWYTKV